MGVVVTNESNMASYFSEAGNLNGSNADMCSYAAGPSSSGSGDLLRSGFQIDQRSCAFTISPITSTTGHHRCLSVTTTPILTFGASYVIMHIKIYCVNCG